MNITQKDIKVLWRSPLLWMVLALLSFIAAWLLWQMVDKYVSIQSGFVNLPNPPNITQSLWTPFVLLMAKLLMLIIAFTTSFSVAKEKSEQTLWYLLLNQNNNT